MRIIVELIITAALAFLAVKLPWPAQLLIVVAYLVAFDRKLPTLARRMQISSRFLCFLTLYVAAGMFMTWVIRDVFLNFPEIVAEIDATPQLKFFLGTPALRTFWAALVGFALPVLPAIATLLPYGVVAGPTLYSQYEQYKGHEWDAAMAAITGLLGISRGTWVVHEGKAEMHGDSGGSLARFGGPGMLIVQEGHAVILEKSGQISQVVGRGITWLEAFERISMVVPLFTRSEKLVVENVPTKDKVLINEIEILILHKADPGPPGPLQKREGQFAYTKQKLKDDIWSPGGGDWRGGVRSVADTATRDVIGRYDLEEIIPISDTFRTDFKRLLTAQINLITNKMGVLIVAVDIGKVKIPAESEAKLLERWSTLQQIQIAHAQKEVDTTRGRARADNHRAIEAARAVAQEQMILALSAGFQAAGIPDTLVPSTMIALRLLEALEKIAEDPATKMVFPSGMSLPDLQALFMSTASAPSNSGSQGGLTLSSGSNPTGSK